METSLAKQWLNHTRSVMDRIENTQMAQIYRAANVMADSIECGRWVHTFGCGHSTLPVEEMYPRIGGFVGFHPMIELPLSFFTHIVGDMGVHQFIFLERVEGYGNQIMKGYNFDPRDTVWIFSHTGINNVNIDVALEAKERGMADSHITLTKAPKEQVRQLQEELRLAREKLNQTEAELAAEQAAVNAFRMHCRLKLDDLVDALHALAAEKQSLLTRLELLRQAQA